jgi:hypothetical protein
MDENTQNDSPAPEPAAPLVPQDLPDPATSDTTPPSRVPLRDRVFGIRGVAAVAVASVLLGGAGGAALGAAGGDDDDQGRNGRPVFNNGQFPGGPGGQGGPGGGRDNRQMLPPNGQVVPPTTAPEGDES